MLGVRKFPLLSANASMGWFDNETALTLKPREIRFRMECRSRGSIGAGNRGAKACIWHAASSEARHPIFFENNDANEELQSSIHSSPASAAAHRNISAKPPLQKCNSIGARSKNQCESVTIIPNSQHE